MKQAAMIIATALLMGAPAHAQDRSCQDRLDACIEVCDEQDNAENSGKGPCLFGCLIADLFCRAAESDGPRVPDEPQPPVEDLL